MLQITDDVFDAELITHLNSAYFNAIQLGFTNKLIDPDTIWMELGDDVTAIMGLPAYLYLKIRIAFDPPTGSILSAFERQITEYEWRVTVQNESMAT